MIVKAMETLKNAYDQVLFQEGHTYKAEVEEHNKNVCYILNELHLETLMRLPKLAMYFEIIEE